MGISRYNAEGYHDPTAHLAVCHVEEGEKILHLSYPNGSMDIQLFCFFPCAKEKAKKFFRLVRRYSSSKDKEKIARCLRQKEQKYQAQIQTFSSRALKESKKEERQYWEARMKEARRLLRRTQGNLELLREVAGYE